MADFSGKYSEYKRLFENYMTLYFNNLESEDEKLKEAMRYSMFAGGKRIRPVLLLAAYDMLGGKTERALPFSLSLECVHTHSLIHDDLPALDNDSLRRGKPTSHTVFGEAAAILAGDALLNLAYEISLPYCVSANEIKALSVLAESTGCRGMLSGQSMDIEAENTDKISVQTLEIIQKNKTGRLLSAPLLMASALSGGKYEKEFTAFGSSLGAMFQITDDILDETGDAAELGKTPRKDEKENKLTAVKVYGLNGAKEKVLFYRNNCLEILENTENSVFLSDLIKNIAERVN